ncbi:hypothetical protein [Aeromonas veronii]|uniref:hypothetical protein n=1 Tax=Aeromonas TaxID=642 RepID=UPI00301D91DA
MSLDIAYSTDVNDYIDPDRAYEFYWSGLIKDKRNFICPGTDCVAQVTCANLDEDVQDMKVSPHFRVYGSHSSSCEVFNKTPLKLHYNEASHIKKERLPIDESVVDLFLLERPESYYDEPSNTPLNQRKNQKLKTINHSKHTTTQENGSIGAIYSVRAIVGRYIRYKKDKSISHRRVNIQGKDVNYRSIFKCIWEQDLESLPEHPVVYYGWAYINRLKSNHGYQIKFKKPFKKGDEELLSTIMISDRLIDSYKVKKLVTTRLEKIINNEKPLAFVFIYGRPYESISKTGVKYANFSITNLDMIDINYGCPLPKEYDK